MLRVVLQFKGGDAATGSREDNNIRVTVQIVHALEKIPKQYRKSFLNRLCAWAADQEQDIYDYVGALCRLSYIETEKEREERLCRTKNRI